MMFQDFGAERLAREEAERRNAAQQAAELIARYPDLSAVERASAIRLYRELSALDMALMISDEELAPKLDHFYKDNWRKLRTPFRQYAVLAAIAVSGIILAIWAGTIGVM
jgi:hypothetical protein